MARAGLILGLHIRDTRNVGDRHSSPLDYFEFPGNDVIIGDMRAPPDCRPDVVIYGGGSITASPDFRAWPNALIIAWGVGHHVRAEPWDAEMLAEHRRAAGLCDLYFPRDAMPGFATIPCASCLHPAFDAPDAPRYPVVRYSAARRVDVSNGRDPHMNNEDGAIEDAVRFLASGETVVTSSYHGAYWARLLGRRVELAPWGSKFAYLPNGDLAACRQANRAAYAAVCARLS